LFLHLFLLYFLFLFYFQKNVKFKISGNTNGNYKFEWTGCTFCHSYLVFMLRVMAGLKASLGSILIFTFWKYFYFWRFFKVLKEFNIKDNEHGYFLFLFCFDEVCVCIEVCTCINMCIFSSFLPLKELVPF
jgi:hypothetical protein